MKSLKNNQIVFAVIIVGIILLGWLAFEDPWLHHHRAHYFCYETDSSDIVQPGSQVDIGLPEI